MDWCIVPTSFQIVVDELSHDYEIIVECQLYGCTAMIMRAQNLQRTCVDIEWISIIPMNGVHGC